MLSKTNPLVYSLLFVICTLIFAFLVVIIGRNPPQTQNKNVSTLTYIEGNNQLGCEIKKVILPDEKLVCYVCIGYRKAGMSCLKMDAERN